MENLKKITRLEYILFAIVLAFAGYGLFLGLTNMDAFLIFTQEDGLAENLTSIFLLAGALVEGYRFFVFKKHKQPGLWMFTAGMLALLFFFAAGEEISWGQRIFGIESSEFFLENNKQAETNLHNLVVGNTSINKLIFSQILVAVLVIYFVFSRWLVKKVAFLGKLQRQFNVPLPKIQHTIVLLIVSGMMALVPSAKNAEILEMAFAFTFFLIFMNPADSGKA